MPEAITAALQHTGVAIITGASTTAVAFFTLCFNDFAGLSELGVIAGSSIILCLAANLVALPAIFILRDRARSPQQLQGAVEQFRLEFYPQLGPIDGANAVALADSFADHLRDLGAEPAPTFASTIICSISTISPPIR